MRSLRRGASLLASLAGALLALLPGAASANGFTRSQALAPGQPVTVRVERADVRVRPQAPDRGDRLHVEARWSGLGAAGVHFRLVPEDGTLVVEETLDDWLRVLRGGPGIDVDLRVPAERAVRIETADGAVDVAGLGGGVEVRSAAGSVRVADVGGGVRVRAEDGRVAIENVRGPVEVESAGAIHVFDASGPVRALARRGAIQLDHVAGAVEARTEHGPVRIRLDAAPRARVDAQGGGIHVSLPERAGGRIDARSAGGRVHLAPEIALAGERGITRVRGILGPGEGLLRLRALGGHILIR